MKNQVRAKFKLPFFIIMKSTVNQNNVLAKPQIVLEQNQC